MKNARSLFCVATLSVLSVAAHAQTWTKLTNTPPAPLGTAMVLTDGTVMVQGMTTSGGGTAKWYRLTPSSTGSYVNGTWTTLASMPAGDNPLYFASAVLADGKVVVVGGEYLGTTESESNKGAIYDPAANTWTAITPPTGWTHIGDAASVVLADGTWMIGNCGVTGTECTNQTYQAQLDESTLTWTIIGAGNGKADQNSEEGWNLLPNGDVLTVDVWDGKNSEVFSPSTNKWTTAGNTVASLVNTTCDEIGAAVLSPKGYVFAVGGTANTGVYTIATGTWSAGPTVPNAYGQEDGPASILPDGNVLIQVGPQSPCYSAPSVFYEFNGSTLTSVPAPTNAVNDPTFVGRLLVLPTGQVLFTDGTTTAEIYTAAGTYESAWQPTISSVDATLASASTSNAISGTQFNGLSQGGAYGDDAQMATNYPLVRVTNTASGDVVYCKTHNHSTMGVATGSATVSTEFDIPATIQLGPSELVVVANGIPSASSSVAIQDATSTAVTANPTSIANTATTTLTATVTDSSNSANTPTGTVTFSVPTNITPLGSCTLASGTCSITAHGSGMATGSNTITAAYSGVTDTYTASSGTTTVTVTSTADATSLAATATPNSISATGSTTLQATVTDTTNGANTPTGSVTFTDTTNSASLGSCTLASGTCSIMGAGSAMAMGSNTISASYAGVANSFAASSGTTAVTVTAAPTAIITFTSVSHNFGQVAVGTAAQSYGIQITNSGSAAYTFGLVFTPANGFTSANNCGTSIAADGKCELVFYFTPAAAGPVSATWSLTPESGASYSPSNGGTLTGSGTAQGGVSITTAGHNFGSVTVGTTSPVYGTVISNSTSAAVTLTLGSVSGTEFASVTNCGATLAAGTSCNLQFTFSPTASGTTEAVFALSSSVAITSGGNPLPNGGVTLTGTGD